MPALPPVTLHGEDGSLLPAARMPHQLTQQQMCCLLQSCVATAQPQRTFGNWRSEVPYHATMLYPKDKARDSGTPLLYCCPSWREAVSSPAGSLCPAVCSQHSPPSQGQQQGCSWPCRGKREAAATGYHVSACNVLPTAGLRVRWIRLSSTRLACTETSYHGPKLSVLAKSEDCTDTWQQLWKKGRG